MTVGSFYRAVMDVSEETDEALVKCATAAVLHALRDRLTSAESSHVRAQLPAELKEVWDEAATAERQPLKLDREHFYDRVACDACLPSHGQARWMTLAVFTALQEQLSPGEAGHVLAQLPHDLKEVWEDARPTDDDRPAPRSAPMQVREVMSPDPITIGPSASLREARAMMIEREVRHLPVVDDGRHLIGIITDRDLRSAAVAPALGEHLSARARRRLRRATEPLEKLRVRDVMTWSVVTTTRSAPIAQAAAIMHERRLGSLPVLDEGVLVGIVTERDALRALARTLAPVRGADPDTYFW